MKKTIALVLALVLCLSLAACGQQERYPEIADLLDAEDYEGAVTEIYKLYREKNPTEPIETTEPKPTVDRNVENKYRGIVNTANNWNDRVANNDRYQWFSASYNEYMIDENGNSTSTYISFSGGEAFAWVYNTALELGDFEKAAEIASRFTLLENKLLELKYITPELLEWLSATWWRTASSAMNTMKTELFPIRAAITMLPRACTRPTAHPKKLSTRRVR